VHETERDKARVADIVHIGRTNKTQNVTKRTS
jgi:hypothetical protein